MFKIHTTELSKFIKKHIMQMYTNIFINKFVYKPIQSVLKSQISVRLYPLSGKFLTKLVHLSPQQKKKKYEKGKSLINASAQLCWTIN